MAPILVPILIAVALTVGSYGQDIDNGLIGEPEVKCGADVVDLQFRTLKPFRGKVFVKGHYADPECKVDYREHGGTDKPNGGIIIHHGACDMHRQRMITPQGMQFSSVIVISFHSVFITKIDKAYHIKCMYRELDKTVTNSFEVSALTTALIAHTLPMPQCTYTIRKDEIDGEVLKYARVGEQVVHRWQCDTDAYGMLVHSCYVEDGQGERVTVVDEKGCHTDRYILGDPTYTDKLNMAYRESHVFKFADKVTVRFQCQIRLCLRMDDGCKGITPPVCASPLDNGAAALLYSNLTKDTNETSLAGSSGGVASSFSLASNSSIVEGEDELANLTARARFQRDVHPQRGGGGGGAPSAILNHHFQPVDGDFNSQYIYVLDSTENPEKGSSKEQDSWKRFLARTGNSGTIVSELHDNVCMSTVTFSLLMSAVTIVFMSGALAAFVIVFQRARQQQRSSKASSYDSSPSTSPSAIVFGGCGLSQSGRIAAADESTISAHRPPSYSHLVNAWRK